MRTRERAAGPTKVVILCGGQGTRIRGVVADDLPKAMVPVGEHPILWHIMKSYEHFGMSDFVLCLGYLGWQIKDYFLDYRYRSGDLTVRLGADAPPEAHDEQQEKWAVTLAETGQLTQTAGRLWKVRRHLSGCDLFCLTYGDGVADIDIDALVAFHLAHGKVATVTAVRPPSRFGDLAAGTDPDLVSVFEEKPQSALGWINGGFFVFDQRIWGYLDGSPEQVLEREPLATLAAAGELGMYRHHGFWQPMDTFREWTLLNDMWSQGKAPWRTQ